MNILLTGATGFVGRHVVGAALARGHRVVALVRSAAAAAQLPWLASAELREGDLGAPASRWAELVHGSNACIHLAWSGLPNYKSLAHLEQQLPLQIAFLSRLFDAGVRRLVVTGTCQEYGMQEGELAESVVPAPATPYAIAKNTLRQYLEQACAQRNVELRWARLFYMYGAGQNPNSLLAQLDRAIDAGEASFNMSGGEQLRDYLPVTKVAAHLVAMAEHATPQGTINVCSGTPISVRRLVEQHIDARQAAIRLNLGFYPYPDYEPRAFWGSARKLAALEAGS